MPSQETFWRRAYASARRLGRRGVDGIRRQPWLAVGGGAAIVIVVVLILSHGRATPSAPVQSLNGQVAWNGRHTHLPGNVPRGLTPEEEQMAAAAAKAPPPPSKPSPPAQPSLPSTAPQQGLWPLAGKVTQGYGWVYQPNGGYWFYNTSWEIAAAAGTQVHSAFPGIVQDIERDPTLGLSVTVQSGGGVVATYGGLSSAQVQIGQQVAAGSVIGQLAPTAPGEGGKPRLHFAIRQGNQPIDPGTYLQAAAP